MWEGNRGTVTVIMDDGSIHQSQVGSRASSASPNPSAEATSITIDANIPLKVHYFLEQGAKKNWPPDFLVTLIENGENLEARDDQGLTPVMLACTSAVPFTYLEILVQKGANVNVQNPFRTNEVSFLKN